MFISMIGVAVPGTATFPPGGGGTTTSTTESSQTTWTSTSFSTTSWVSTGVTTTQTVVSTSSQLVTSTATSTATSTSSTTSSSQFQTPTTTSTTSSSSTSSGQFQTPTSTSSISSSTFSTSTSSVSSTSTSSTASSSTNRGGFPKVVFGVDYAVAAYPSSTFDGVFICTDPSCAGNAQWAGARSLGVIVEILPGEYGCPATSSYDAWYNWAKAKLAATAADLNVQGIALEEYPCYGSTAIPATAYNGMRDYIRSVDSKKLVGFVTVPVSGIVSNIASQGGYVDYALSEDYGGGLGDYNSLRTLKAAGHVGYIGTWINANTDPCDAWTVHHNGDTIVILPMTNGGAWGSWPLAILPQMSLVQQYLTVNVYGSSPCGGGGGCKGRGCLQSWLDKGVNGWVTLFFLPMFGGGQVAVNYTSPIWIIVEVAAVIGAALMFLMHPGRRNLRNNHYFLFDEVCPK